jgi:hypothetical protein
MEATQENAYIKELFRIIDEDEYAWVACWGPPRTGKSMLCLLTGYWIYKDWNDVLNSITFNLNGVLYKLINGEPRKFPTRNGYNKRIPYLFIDDFGANCNKAITQYNRGWDLFKGAFDTLGTMVAVLMANMVKPDEATLQLTQKYTHELWVHHRGKAKFDTVQEEQSYSNWQTRQKKDWFEDFTFGVVPEWVYEEYNKMRVQLAREALFNIQETIAVNEVELILKRIQPADKLLLFGLADYGKLYDKKAIKIMGGAKGHEEAIMKCKAKGIILSERQKNNYYKYTLTGLGHDVIAALKEQG